MGANASIVRYMAWSPLYSMIVTEHAVRTQKRVMGWIHVSIDHNSKVINPWLNNAVINYEVRRKNHF